MLEPKDFSEQLTRLLTNWDYTISESREELIYKELKDHFDAKSFKIVVTAIIRNERIFPVVATFFQYKKSEIVTA